MSIPALSRGLAILEHLMGVREGCTYTELKGALPLIPDASLMRLLQSLVASGHLTKDEARRYTLSSRAKAWEGRLAGRKTFTESAAESVARLSRDLAESAAAALLQEGHIRILASESFPDSITVIGKGSVLHFESDHAAALAILHAMDRAAQKRAIASEVSRIRNLAGLRKAISATHQHGIYVDRSTVRQGVSRVAAPLRVDGAPGAVFVCLPTVRVATQIKRIRERLLTCQDQLSR